MNGSIKRILVVNPFGIGDAIFSMTLVEAIRAVSPHAVIGFLCNERTQGLVRLNSSIDQTFVFNRDLFRALWKESPVLFVRRLSALLKVIRDARFDTLLDLSLDREYSFFAMCAGIKRRVGFDYKGRGIFLNAKKKIEGYAGKPVAEIQLELLELLGISKKEASPRLPLAVPAETKSEVSDFLRKHGIGENDKVFSLAPGGGRSWGKDAVFKQWDAERFAQTVNQFCETRRCKILLLGDGAEADLLHKTAGLIKSFSLTLSDEPFDRLCAFLLRSSFLFCNDGGLLHLANALGIRTVSIFGPVDEKVYGPYGKETPREVLTENVPCRPCYKNFHFPSCPYARRCLTDLPVEKALAALEKIA